MTSQNNNQARNRLYFFNTWFVLTLPFIALAIAMLWKAQGNTQPFSDVRHGEVVLAEGNYMQYPLVFEIPHGMESAPEYVQVSLSMESPGFLNDVTPPDFFSYIDDRGSHAHATNLADYGLALPVDVDALVSSILGSDPYLTEITDEHFVVELHSPLTLPGPVSVEWTAYDCNRHCVTDADREGETHVPLVNDGVRPVALDAYGVVGSTLVAMTNQEDAGGVEYTWETSPDGASWTMAPGGGRNEDGARYVQREVDAGGLIRVSAEYRPVGATSTVTVASYPTLEAVSRRHVEVGPQSAGSDTRARQGLRLGAMILDAPGGSPTGGFCCYWFVADSPSEWRYVSNTPTYTPVASDVNKELVVFGDTDFSILLQPNVDELVVLDSARSRGTVVGPFVLRNATYPQVFVVPHGLGVKPDVINLTNRSVSYSELANPMDLGFGSRHHLNGVDFHVDPQDRHSPLVLDLDPRIGAVVPHMADEDNLILFMDGSVDVLPVIDWEARVCGQDCSGENLSRPLSTFPKVSISTRYPVVGEPLSTVLATSTGTLGIASATCKWQVGRVVGDITNWVNATSVDDCDSFTPTASHAGLRIRSRVTLRFTDSAISPTQWTVNSLASDPVRGYYLNFTLRDSDIVSGTPVSVRLTDPDVVTSFRGRARPTDLIDGANPTALRNVSFFRVQVGDEASLARLSQSLGFEIPNLLLAQASLVQMGDSLTYTPTARDVGHHLMALYEYYVESPESTATEPVFEIRTVSYIMLTAVLR